jgi:hypothetical protein
MIRLTEDLRFFIGAFFLIVGAFLTFEGLRSGTLVEGFNLNLITGIGFVGFSLIALGLAARANRRS